MKECYRILIKGGRLIIRGIPDFDLIVDAYLNKRQGNVSERFDLYEVYRLTHGDPIPRNSPHQLHKDIFTKDYIRGLLKRHRFVIEKMEDKLFPGENIPVSFDVVAVKLQ